MRQVNRDEFAWAIASALRKVPASLRKHFMSGTFEQQQKARAIIAIGIADELKRFEILTDTPLPLVQGEEAYSRPLDNLLGDGRL